MAIHPTAVVAPEARLAPDVEVGPYAVIGPGVEIGAGTTVGAHAVITGRTALGCGNRVFQFASLGEVPQDKKYAGEDSALEIGDGNTIREFVTVNCGTAQDRNVTRIGDRNWIMAYVHIAHDCVVGDDITFANGATLAGHVEIGDHAVLGGFSLVHQFCRVGRHAFSGMGAALNRDLPPYLMAAGNPARLYGLNSEGLRRAAFAPELVEALGKTCRWLAHGRPGADAAAIEQLAGRHPEVAALRDFAGDSRRGVLKHTREPD